MKAHNPSHQEAFPPEIPVTRRHTHRGDAATEARIQQDVSRLAAGMAAELGEAMDALLLVGAYARGEAGVITRGGEGAGYPGYTCLLLAGRAGVAPERLAELRRAWAARLEIDIHFAVAPTSELPRMPASLWWLDIARGNVEVLTGDPKVLQKLPALDVRSVRARESSWLLADTAAAVARSRLATGVDVRDRLRHLHYAAVACGDARVLASGRFAGNMRARRAQLEALRPPVEMLDAYADAIRFLGCPDEWQPKTGDIDEWESAMLDQVAQWHLSFESQRLGMPATVDGFARARMHAYSNPRGAGLRGRVEASLRKLLAPAPGFPYHDTAKEIVPRAAVALAYGGDAPSNRLMAARLLGLAATGTPPTAQRLLAALERLQRQLRESDPGRLFDGPWYGPT